MASILDHTIFYASKGWYVFPLKPREKVPLVKWADIASITPSTIHDWWKAQPDSNVGIVTGAKSGITVLDIDALHDGEKSIDELIDRYGDIPETPICVTGGGGRHMFFSYAVGTRNSAGKLGPGLDIRSDGGYVVGANSIHPNGNEYKWDKNKTPSKTSLAPMPIWMINLIMDEEPKPISEKAFQDGSQEVYATGARNQTLTSLAGSMRRRGMSEEAICTALIQENSVKCIPPLPIAEVYMIAKSISRYDPKNPPIMQNKARTQIEWALAKSLFEFPIDLAGFSWVRPDMFNDKSLQIFWASLQSGKPSTSAATEAQILTELQAYKEYDSTRVDDYAQELAKFAHYDLVSHYANGLLRAAGEQDQPQVEKLISEIGKNASLQTIHRVTSITDLSNMVEADIKKRSEAPGEIWGIPYAFPYLSLLTGGKQLGELIILAGEPKVGKSWWVYQDALETAIKGTPVFIWSGEMRRKQVMRRLYQLYGLNSRRSRTGYMKSEDWDILNEAKEAITGCPLYIDDNLLKLEELRGILMHEKEEHGIQQFVIDYAMLLHAPGKDEIERSANVSTELKNLCSELLLAGILIASVNKMGMDTASENVTKSNVRGSGQQIHDADVIFMLTKFCKTKDPDENYIQPSRWDNIVSLHVKAGRELDHHLPNGIIHYERMNGTPRFKELKEIENKPEWVEPSLPYGDK